MKCLLLSVFSIFCNILLIHGQNNNGNEVTTNDSLALEITKEIKYNSILEDINNFYNQNVKYQVATKDDSKTASDNKNTNENAKSNTNSDNTTNADKNNNNASNANSNTKTNTNSDTNAKTNTNSNGNSNGNAKNNDIVNNNNKGNSTATEGDENKETGCGSDRASLGMFAFHKPIKRSILVINSNFTIVWSYNNILEGYEYNYPQNDVTFKLYYEDDANPNNWSNAWKNPVFEKTIPLADVEQGVILNGIQTYQYNWFIDPKDGFIRNPKSNEKYKLRIYGDGKDVQSNNANFKCYGDGDIQPGLTVAFYIVDNNRIEDRYYKQIPIIDNGTGMQSKTSLMSFITTILLILYYIW
ncbi:hypothetical protein H8356DRAFT_974671 [Neocallimastix lanati (nom. inval.)]|jgi:hypothetical protein|uniref:Uncharacterized protein n=1 Tax=Neocallimastix californiae TaxID=1754190 RepID=A0A1Y2F4J6_9FUNG|nr:hypothetical protein H8356DRAFT_974671 [Neocallimastix sp. JGI-2020a]ORY78799.1 hypothetical protein LY90DRAFT_664960 [Neocallimastix californiae]|eukprot:ORY78799.1 hypothetical protein LY90DRAFT_664960 [Neocallimastix californiae]